MIEAHATELKLPTVKRRFRQMAAEATREQQTPVAYLAALLEAEMAERAERREKRRLIDARFPLIKRLEEFRFADNPKVPQATIAALAEMRGTFKLDLLRPVWKVPGLQDQVERTLRLVNLEGRADAPVSGHRARPAERARRSRSSRNPGRIDASPLRD